MEKTSLNCESLFSQNDVFEQYPQLGLKIAHLVERDRSVRLQGSAQPVSESNGYLRIP